MRLVLLWFVLAASLSAQTLESGGPTGAAVMSRCLTCHEADLIEQQRLTRTGWDREIAKMERWGATVSTLEREALLTYLAIRFAPGSAGSLVSEEIARGESIYRTACRSCHDDDLALQQRLSRPAWERTIDKMVRWGAQVTAAEKGPLAAYLASQAGPAKQPPTAASP